MTASREPVPPQPCLPCRGAEAKLASEALRSYARHIPRIMTLAALYPPGSPEQTGLSACKLTAPRACPRPCRWSIIRRRISPSFASSFTWCLPAACRTAGSETSDGLVELLSVSLRLTTASCLGATRTHSFQISGLSDALWVPQPLAARSPRPPRHRAWP